MKTYIALIALCCGAASLTLAAEGGTSPALLKVKRVYVDHLTGDSSADALRELIISSINSTGLFALTDNPDRADAILRGAASDQTFTETHDSESGISTRQNGGKYGSSSSSLSKTSGGYAGLSLSDNESLHTKERKHEAYATVRICDKDGDVLWSTTQESGGAKFRGASADVAAKVARQLTLDVDIIRRTAR